MNTNNEMKLFFFSLSFFFFNRIPIELIVIIIIMKRSITQCTLQRTPFSLFHHSLSLHNSNKTNRIVIPTIPQLHNNNHHHTISKKEINTEYAQNKNLPPSLNFYLDEEHQKSIQRQKQLTHVKDEMNTLSEGIWKSSKSHLRKQEKMMEQYGVEGAVRETLLASQHRRHKNNNTNSISFHEQIRQRPLDRTILEDIYKNLHGRRIERKLKKGVSYEHWITKGDGTAPVFTASLKAKQTFAFGGEVKLIKKCTHPSEFPVFPRPGISKNENRNKKLTPKDLYMPEVAFIGRTSSGKSSLLNSILNLQVAPYGHLQGTTTAAHFYTVGGKERGITLVDLPGYGFYHPMSAAAVDAGNAVATMRAYLHSASEVKFKPRGDNKNKNQNNGKEGSYTDAFLHLENPLTVKDPYPSSSRGNKNNNHHKGVSVQRNVARVFLCCSARGLQELDYQYCELLNELHIPFAVVFTKTDAAPIRFLARLCDYTRERLVAFPYCEELLLTSALRLSGIEQIQNIIGSMSTEREATTVAEDFSAIV